MLSALGGGRKHATICYLEEKKIFQNENFLQAHNPLPTIPKSKKL